MLNTYSLSLGILLALAMLLTTGCDPRAKQEGEHGNFRFHYIPADGVTNFKRSIAVGSVLTMYIEGVDDKPVDRIVTVQSSNDEILLARPSQNQGNGISLRGVGPGSSKLTVEATSSSGTKLDEVTINVAQVRHVELEHTCGSDSNVAYIQHRPIRLDIKRQDADGKTLVGHSDRCSVRLQPDDLEAGVRCDEGGLYLPGVSTPGTLKVTGIVGDRRGRTHDLNVQVVTRDKIDFRPAEGSLKEGRASTVNLVPHTDRWPICHDFELDIAIVTPHICLGNGRERNFQVPAEDGNEFWLRGIAPGECVFNVLLPEFGNSDMWEFSVYVDADE